MLRDVRRTVKLRTPIVGLLGRDAARRRAVAGAPQEDPTMKTALRVLLPLVLAGCAAAPITSTVQSRDDAGFAKASTFSIVAPVEANAPIAPKLHAAVDAALTDGLKRHGYVPATGTPDLKVEGRAVATGRVYPAAPDRPRAEMHTSVGPGDPYGSYAAPGGAEIGANTGMLLVTITNAAGRVVWQATAEGAATGESSAVTAASRAAAAAIEQVPKATR